MIGKENMSNQDIQNENNKSTKESVSRPAVVRDTTYWKSFEELNNTPEFQAALQTEFMSSPLREEFANEGTEKDSFARREFMKLMGASIALTTAAGCVRRPVQKIVPYVKQPEDVTLGVSSHYTSTYFDGQEGFGLLVKAREGRPVHIAGNPLHVGNGSAVSVRAQASLLGLYDPERLQKPIRHLMNEKRTNFETVGTTWEGLDKKVVEELQKGGVAILTGNIPGPATEAVVSDFCSGFKAEHFSWESLSVDTHNGALPVYRYDKAKVIVSIDADFLGAWGPAISATRLFAEGRRNPESMSRLYSFDSTYSLTAANADIRHKIKPSLQLDVVLGLISEISGSGSVNYDKLGISAEAFKKVAKDLAANKGQSVVVCGGLQTQTADAETLQKAVHHLNQILGNDGKTIFAGPKNSKASYESLFSLIKKCNQAALKL